MKDRKNESPRASDERAVSQQLERGFLEEIFGRVGIDSEARTSVRDELGSLLAIEQDAFHGGTRGESCLDFHRVKPLIRRSLRWRNARYVSE
jgi:hypothetical protein